MSDNTSKNPKTEFEERKEVYTQLGEQAQDLGSTEPPLGKPYANMITQKTAKPLSVFLGTLGSKEYSELLFDFLQSPFITARRAGVPYAAALMLGSGDWERISAALMAENDQRKTLVAQVTEALGPVWVKAR